MSTMHRKFSGCIRAYKVNDSGVKIGEIFELGNVATLGLDTKKELVKAISNKCDSAGQTLASRAKPAVATGNISCEEWQPDVVVEALGATASAQTISSSTLTAEVVTLKGYGYWADIGAKRLSSVVVKDSTGVTTLVLGTDYLLDEYMGLIKPIEGSAELPLGTEDVQVTATGAADTTPVYTIGAGTSGLYAIIGKLRDAWSNKVGELFLRKVRLVLTNEVSFVAGQDEEFSPLEFEASPEIVDGQSGFGTFAGEVLE